MTNARMSEEQRMRIERGRGTLLYHAGFGDPAKASREELEEFYIDAMADLMHAAHADGLDITKIRDLADLHLDEELDDLGR